MNDDVYVNNAFVYDQMTTQKAHIESRARHVHLHVTLSRFEGL